VEVERIVLYSLVGGRYVTSFRTARLTPAVQEELAAARAAEAERLEAIARRKAQHVSPAAAAAPPLQSTLVSMSGTEGAVSKSGGTADAAPQGMSKSDLRRAARKQREAAWAAFNATRPDDK
jgi:hypothetical protein